MNKQKTDWDTFVKENHTNFSKDANGIKYEFYEEDLLNLLQQQREEIVSEIEGILKHGCESCMGDLHEGCKCDFERIKLFRELLQSLKK